ncbi:MAG: TRAP transporter substrate-binding protein DctP [Casimicrobiaceae bacterium]
MTLLHIKARRFTSLRTWVIAAAALAFAVNASAQTIVMRISHQVPPAHHMTKLLEGFAADVKNRTNGQVEVQLYGSEQLAKAAENFPAVARGTIEAAMSVNFQWGTTIPEMSATLIPYAMGDLEKIKRFPTSEARRFLDQKLEQRGVKSLAWLYITRETIITSGKKAIVNLDDFKGVKIRGLNTLTDNALTAVGAAPSAMPGSEVYQALQSGVLDAGLTDVSAAYSRKYYEVQKYGTVGPIFTIYFHMYVNPAWWNKLSPAHRQALEAAAAKVEQEAITVTEATAAAAVKDLQVKGMEIHVQTPQEQKTWAGAMRKPVVDAFVKSAPEGGPKIIELLDKL